MAIKERDTIIANELNNCIIPYAKATGTVNNYEIKLDNVTAYYEGLRACVLINIQNTGKSYLNVNGLGKKILKDIYGNEIKAGGLLAKTPYQFCYNGNCFILLGKGDMGGTATSEMVLSGYTFMNESGRQIGTMPNNGKKIFTPGINNIPLEGYYAPGSYIKGDSNLKSENIISGKSIFGVNGTGSTGFADVFKYPLYSFKFGEFAMFGDRNLNTINGVSLGSNNDTLIIMNKIMGEHSIKIHVIKRGNLGLWKHIPTVIRIEFPKNIILVNFPSSASASHSPSSGTTSLKTTPGYLYLPNNNYCLSYDGYISVSSKNNDIFEPNSNITKELWLYDDVYNSFFNETYYYANYGPYKILFDESIPDTFD